MFAVQGVSFCICQSTQKQIVWKFLEDTGPFGGVTNTLVLNTEKIIKMY